MLAPKVYWVQFEMVRLKSCGQILYHNTLPPLPPSPPPRPSLPSSSCLPPQRPLRRRSTCRFRRRLYLLTPRGLQPHQERPVSAAYRMPHAMLGALAWLGSHLVLQLCFLATCVPAHATLADLRPGRGTTSRPISIQSSPMAPLTQTPPAMRRLDEPALRLVRRNLATSFTGDKRGQTHYHTARG